MLRFCCALFSIMNPIMNNRQVNKMQNDGGVYLLKTGKAFISFCLAFLLAFSLLPLSFAYSDEADEISGWAQGIPSLLAEGEYAEGEVIACVKDVSALSRMNDNTEVETIFDLDIEDSNGDGLVVVHSDSLSTEDILYHLAKNPGVLFAEPNYRGVKLADEDPLDEEDTDVARVTEPSASAESAREPIKEPAKEPIRESDSMEPEEFEKLSAEEETENTDASVNALARALTNGSGASAKASSKDLASFQWGYVNNSSTLQIPGVSNTASVNPPQWNQPGGNMEDQEVVVALLDTGVDLDHPDLDGSIYQFTESQQQALGCGKFGFNAMSVADPAQDATDVMDRHYHGTHCAGIIAAEWDGKGTSGVASNAKVMVIRNGDGSTSIVDQLNAYAFIKKAVLEQGINVKVTSNSWGVYQPTRALDYALRDLGETCGIISIFGAGNENVDNDKNLFSSSTLKDNPYVAVIAATNPSDRRWKGSNYGANTVDVACPGATILSTVPFKDACYAADLVDEGSNLAYSGFEGYAGGLVGGTASGASSTLSSAAAGDDFEINAFTYNDGVIPFDDANPHDTSAAMSGSGSFSATLDTPYDEDWNNSVYALEFSAKSVPLPAEGGGATFGAGLYCQSWLSVYDVMVKTQDGSWEYVDDSEFHRQKCTGENWDCFDIDLPEQTDFADFKLLLVIKAKETPRLWIDSVGIGTQKIPYDFLTGTSMATPAAAGACAVFAARFPNEDPAARIDRLKASVRPNDSFAGITTTGGVLDISFGTALDVVSFGPKLDSIEVNESGKTVTITGARFGASAGQIVMTQAGLSDDGAAYSTTISLWSDEETIFKIADEEWLSGTVEVGVRTSAGKTARRTFFFPYAFCDKKSFGRC